MSSQHRAAEHGPAEGRLWRPEPVSGGGREAGAHTVRQGGDSGAESLAGRPDLVRRPAARPQSLPSIPLPLAGNAPLTALGVAIVLLGACLLGAALDLLLVGTAAWALTGLFLGAAAYAATKVRRSDWYSAVVGPPLAFACGLLLVAFFSPHDMGSGLTGAVATILEFLAFKARAVFFGTGVALAITLARKLPFRR
jgi:hypothetical protein